MSWGQTYTHTLAIAVDMLTCSIFWNKADVCVSSLCGLELRREAVGLGSIWVLATLGRGLNCLQVGHCELSIQGDIDRCSTALALLGGVQNAPKT